MGNIGRGRKTPIMQIDRVPVGFLGTVCYILSDENKQAVIIDPGAEAQKISALIEKKNLKPGLILITHGHYDHVQAINSLKEKYAIPAYINKADIPLINSKVQDSLLGMSVGAIAFEKYLEDGQVIELGKLKLKTLATPGHTTGSISFVGEQNVFTGDTLFADGDIGRTDLWGGSEEQIIASIRDKLFALPDEYIVYPGHGNRSTIGKEKQRHADLL